MRRISILSESGPQSPLGGTRPGRYFRPHHSSRAAVVSSVVSEKTRTLTPSERRRSLYALYSSALAALILLLASAGVGRAGTPSVSPSAFMAAPADASACRVFPSDNAWNQ